MIYCQTTRLLRDFEYDSYNASQMVVERYIYGLYMYCVLGLVVCLVIVKWQMDALTRMRMSGASPRRRSLEMVPPTS